MGKCDDCQEGRQATMEVDFVHTGPETLAGRYLRLFWEPVYRADDLSCGASRTGSNHEREIHVVSG